MVFSFSFLEAALEDYEGLFDAIFYGNAAVVEHFIISYPVQHIIGQTDFWERNTLHCASIVGHKSVVALLLSHDTLQDMCMRVDHAGRTPLHWACMNGHLDVVELLLLHCTRAVVALLVPHNVVHNALQDMCMQVDHAGRTALHWACINGHQDVVELLLLHCTSPNFLTQSDVLGLTSLHYACEGRFKGIVQLLLRMYLKKKLV